ncbi:MAG: CcoQ/FixQ family Cbb3-type cytochrome c oxidase assembly chaperone [Rhodothermales bacterium]|nr:CcoQ/FixQ family Cbb3-type cytochrome c oxidase assembly chaperone [Rhodothermales bacterium]
MHKDVLRLLDVGMLPQVGLVAFVVVFFAILVYTFTLSRADVAERSDLPFDEAVPVRSSDPSSLQ